MLLQLLKTIAALAGILGLIFGLAYLVKRFNLAGPRADGGTEGWRLLGIRALGPKRQVYVLEVGSHVLLIGTTDRTMSTLMEISDPAEKEKLIGALTKPKRTITSFQDLLRRAES
ncbi:MAG TPA: flagellar biosynthetic protein FliO [bacterium]|jgi:flagellar biosynthetic protein FliO